MAGYGFYQSFRVDAAQVGGSTLTNFPVLVSITAAQFKTVANGGKVKNASGFDIVFTLTPKANGPVLLNWEVELWNGTTGQLVAWVQIPSLSALADTTFYAEFGNAAITVAQNVPANTWDANFVGVAHCNDANFTTKINNSATNAAGITQLAGVAGTAATVGTGVVDGDAVFGAIADYESNPTGITAWPTLPVTMSLLFNSSVAGFCDPIAYPGTGGAGSSGMRIGLFTPVVQFSPYFVIDNLTTGFGFTTINLAKGVWNYVAVQADAAGNLTCWAGPIGGALATENGTNAGAITTTKAISLGAFASPFMFFTGSLDEGRWSKSLRGAGWITAEFNTISSATFITPGAVKPFLRPGGTSFRWFYDEQGDESGQWE